MPFRFPKLTRIGFLLAFNAILILLLVYAFEFFLEWKDPRKRLPANTFVNGQLVTWGNVVTNNSLGFREREIQIPKPDGVFRIVVLGDSLTWGAGLAPAQRYTNLLEQTLNETGAGKFEVLNFGRPAAATTDEREVLRKFGQQLQPDLIMVGFCINDPQPKSQNYSVEREQFENRYRRLFASARYRLGSVHLSAVGELAVAAAYGLAEKTHRIPTWEQALARTYEQSSPEWQNFVAALREIKQISDDMKLPAPIFAALNQSGRTGADYAHPDAELGELIKWTRQAEAVAAEIGFRSVDFEREIPIEMPNEPMAVNELDGHPSAKLNEVYAKKLVTVVSEHLKSNKKDLAQIKKQ